MAEFKETPERLEVVRELEEAQAHLERAAELLSGQDNKDRAHKVRNVAQGAVSQRSLCAQDWSIEDRDAQAAA
ncbi:MAG TPA: hypothetical protein VN256_08210 [Pyrinomonadaceae bacterium]|nr:hypothetical protein [Pyrinomonadaceae bacterium]